MSISIPNIVYHSSQNSIPHHTHLQSGTPLYDYRSVVTRFEVVRLDNAGHLHRCHMH